VLLRYWGFSLISWGHSFFFGASEWNSCHEQGTFHKRKWGKEEFLKEEYLGKVKPVKLSYFLQSSKQEGVSQASCQGKES
jgi:hypothetical protein